MTCFCISIDGTRVEEIYIIPFNKEIKKRRCINIIKNPSNGDWYKQYRVIKEGELKRANEIWQKIISNK